jgi:hypothetical protein
MTRRPTRQISRRLSQGVEERGYLPVVCPRVHHFTCLAINVFSLRSYVRSGPPTLFCPTHCAESTHVTLQNESGNFCQKSCVALTTSFQLNPEGKASSPLVPGAPVRMSSRLSGRTSNATHHDCAELLALHSLSRTLARQNRSSRDDGGTYSEGTTN